MTLITTLALLLTSLAAIVTSFTLLWVKLVRPAMKIAKRLGKVTDVILALPEWAERIEGRLDSLTDVVTTTHQEETKAIRDALFTHVDDRTKHF